MKITPLTLKEAALAWAQEKHVEVLGRSGWARIFKPGEMGTREEANKCWSSFVFWDATHLDSSLKEFRLVEGEGEL